MENEEWDEGFGAEEFISFDEELPEYDEIMLMNVFFKMVDIQTKIIILVLKLKLYLSRGEVGPPFLPKT